MSRVDENLDTAIYPFLFLCIFFGILGPSVFQTTLRSASTSKYAEVSWPCVSSLIGPSTLNVLKKKTKIEKVTLDPK